MSFANYNHHKYKNRLNIYLKCCFFSQLLYEFKLTMGSDITEEILLRWKKLMFALDKIYGSRDDVDDDSSRDGEPEYTAIKQINMINQMEGEIAVKKNNKLLKQVAVSYCNCRMAVTCECGLSLNNQGNVFLANFCMYDLGYVV